MSRVRNQIIPGGFLVLLAPWIAPDLASARSIGREDYSVGRFSVREDGRLEPVEPDPQESLEVTLGARVIGARWVHPSQMQQGAPAGAPQLQPTWHVQTWRVEQGLPENEIKALCQTPNGYLWVGTPSGLARFDGNRFVVFDERNTQVLQQLGDDIRVLKSDNEGRLWLATVKGLARLHDGRWEIVGRLDSMEASRIRDFSVGPDGTAWVGTKLGLMRAEHGRLTTNGIPPECRLAEVMTVLATGDGMVWTGSMNGILRWDPSRGESVAVWNGESNASIISPMSALHATSDGVVWGASPGAVIRFDRDGMKTMTLPEGDYPAGSIAPNRLSSASGGGVWTCIGPEWSVCRVGPQGLERIADSARKPIQNVQCLFHDSEGNVWCGSRGDGLHRLRPTRIQAIAVQEPAGNRSVVSVMEGPKGEIWVGGRSGLMGWGRSGAIQLSYPDEGGYGAKTYSLSRRGDGTVWASFLAQGAIEVLKAVERGGSEDCPTGNRMGYNLGAVRAMSWSGQDTAWLGTTSGVYRVRATGERAHFQWGSPLEPYDVRVLLTRRSGEIWAGTARSGLGRLEDGEHAPPDSPMSIWTTRDGLPDNAVWSLHEDEDGVVWIGTENGLARWDGRHLFKYTDDDSPLTRAIYQILEDSNGRLWMSGRRGIWRTDRAALNSIFLRGPSTIPYTLFGELDGVPNASMSGECQPSGCRSSDGHLYFPTPAGLAVVDPRNEITDLPPPRVVIEQVVADGSLITGEADQGPKPDHALPALRSGLNSPVRRQDQPSHLGPGRARDLRIRYTATSLTAPERLRFEYRLEGLETEWRPGGAERMAYYTNLKPGNYRFQVRAANHQGTWSEAPAEWAFRLEPAFHQTALFPLTIALVGVAVAGGFTLWRLSWQRKVMLLEQRVALDRERKRIARDMHDDLGAQLSTLALQLSGTSEATARTSPDAQHKVRDVIRHLNSLIWAVEPGHESVEALTDFLGNFAQEYLGRAGLRSSLECPESSGMQASLSTEARRHVVAVVKEALRNVVRHAHATEVRLRFAVHEATLVVEIEDDGQGFDASQAPQDRGLGHMRERLSEVGGRCEVASVPGQGTRIRIAVGLGDVIKPKNPVPLGY